MTSVVTFHANEKKILNSNDKFIISCSCRAAMEQYTFPLTQLKILIQNCACLLMVLSRTKERTFLCSAITRNSTTCPSPLTTVPNVLHIPNLSPGIKTHFHCCFLERNKSARTLKCDDKSCIFFILSESKFIHIYGTSTKLFHGMIIFS